MATHPSVVERLARLAADQRTAATAPPGPVLCVAPAGSGKTTTLVARIAWLVAQGVDPTTICAITFNKRAAEELAARLGEALESVETEPGAVRVRTFHALGREILRTAGVAVEPLADRASILRQIAPSADGAARRRFDDAISRLKLDLGVTPDEVANDPLAGPVARAFVTYERAVAATGGLDFDDLVVRSLGALEGDPELLARWRGRCAHLLVDEVQDVDRSQLRLAFLLAAPANRIFLVGDDDQSIYGWRLADVRRVLALSDRLPGLRRIDLTTNYRCPAPVVERSVRLVERNGERFAKRIVPRPRAAGRLVLAADAADDAVRIGRVLETWPADGSTRAILARTNRELLPAIAAALERNVPFRAPEVPLVLDSPAFEGIVERARHSTPMAWPLLARLARVRDEYGEDAGAGPPDPPDPSDPSDSLDPKQPGYSTRDVANAILAWAAPFEDLDDFAVAVAERRARLAALRRPDAALTLATAHATKGLEFDHVAVVGLEVGRFPSARALSDADDPARALEEERRLAYVAWTRARRSLTLVFDPAAPSSFLLEAFDAEELGVRAQAEAGVMS